MRFFSIAPWLDFELAFVANSGMWIGHRFALSAGNRYKGESRKATIHNNTENALVPMSQGMKFGCRDKMNRSIDSLITLLLVFWCFAITFIKNGVNLHSNTDRTLKR